MAFLRLVSTDSPPPKIRLFERRSLISFKPNELWRIQSGVVRTMSWHDDGTVINLGLWGTGDIISPLLSTADPYHIECLTTVEAIQLAALDYSELNAALIKQIHNLQDLLKILHCRPVDQALVQFLSWLAQKFGREVKKGKMIELRLSHQEIAEMLRTTRVTVTRTLNDFERQGIIERFSGQSILLLNEFATWHYEI
jgi:CRP-like cAMP-binding protein